MSSVLFAQDSSLLGVSASEVLAAPQKQSLRDVEREIDARLHEIAELESELLLTTELELLQEEEVRVRSKQATIAEEDDAVSLLSVGGDRPAPAIKRMKKRPEDARWRYLQQCVDPTERCRALLLHSVIPRPPVTVPKFPKMPRHSTEMQSSLSHDPLEWRLQRCFEGL